MRHAPLYLALTFISSGQASAQDAVADWFPIHAGDKWVYQYETRDNTGGGQAHPEIHRWNTEETITGSWSIPQGMLVGRQVRVTEGSPGYAWQPSLAYLIRGECLYRVSARDWETPAHRLTPDFLKRLGAGEISADFCFPLVVHKAWGAPQWGGIHAPSKAKDWEVVGFTIRDPSVPGKRDTFQIASDSSYPGSGTTVRISFEKGVGIVREEKIHHGTIGEDRSRLLRFESESPHMVTHSVTQA